MERAYELGREVAVTNRRPGGVTRLSVAVAVNDEALKAAAPLTAARLERLAEQGEDGFSGYLLPHAALKLKQLIGELYGWIQSGQ